ncbi:heterochromatin protein 1-binding protein 3 [Sardina pilchardus]|uniref:heterochromatin protein 1-binding protein 3 n=1 Tax=Sardina pilchardus TaxID=27697 RepID=UPI002E141331
MRRASIRRGPGTGDEQAPADGAPKAKESTANSDEAAPMEEEATAAAKEAEAPAPEAEGEKKEAAGEKGEGGEETPAEGGDGGAVEGEAKDKEADGEAKADGEAAEETGKKKKSKDKKEDKEGTNEVKVKKVKKSIPAWASLPSVKRAGSKMGTKTVMQHPKVHDILIEAIQSSKERSGTSVFVILKYIMSKYAFLELDKRKFLLRQSMKRLVEKGAIKQLKGKGFAGSFAIGNLSAVSNSGNKRLAVVVAPGVKAETLGDCLPLIMTRLCEPKEASYLLIKKYLAEHYPLMDVEKRPDILKNGLQRAVERGQLEQITGKGATGTFQLKKTGDKPATVLEDAIVTAIIAMNEPKSCSINTLRKFLIESHKDRKEYLLMNQLKRTLEKGKTMGWIEQITGHGLSGSYQLSYPYYPSPAILFPDKIAKQKKKEEEKAKRKRMADSEDEESEEESEEEEDSEDDEPPRKRGQQRRPAPKARSAAPQRRGKPASRKPPAKRSAPPPKRAAPPAKKKAPPPARKPAAKKAAPPAKATPVKKAAPARTPKTPVAKKLTSRVAKRPPGKKAPARAAKADETEKAKAAKSPEPAKAKRAKAEQPAKAKPAARKSTRVKK